MLRPHSRTKGGFITGVLCILPYANSLWFFFPGGLKVTREHKEEQFHFLVFTDVFGNKSHGVVMQCYHPILVYSTTHHTSHPTVTYICNVFKCYNDITTLMLMQSYLRYTCYRACLSKNMPTQKWNRVSCVFTGGVASHAEWSWAPKVSQTFHCLQFLCHIQVSLLYCTQRLLVMVRKHCTNPSYLANGIGFSLTYKMNHKEVFIICVQFSIALAFCRAHTVFLYKPLHQHATVTCDMRPNKQSKHIWTRVKTTTYVPWLCMFRL